MDRLAAFCRQVGVGQTPWYAAIEGDLVEVATEEGGRLVVDTTTAAAVGLPVGEAAALASEHGSQPSLLATAAAYAEAALVPARTPRWLEGLGGEAYRECPGSRNTVWFGPHGAFALFVPA